MKKTLVTESGRVYEDVEQLDNAEETAAGIQNPTPFPYGPHGSDRFWDTGAPAPPYPRLLGVTSMAPPTFLLPTSDNPYPYTREMEQTTASYRLAMDMVPLPVAKNHNGFTRILQQVNRGAGYDNHTAVGGAAPHLHIWGVMPWRDDLPMRGGAWFLHKSLALQYLENVVNGWGAWTCFANAKRSFESVRFSIVGPLGPGQFVKLMAGGLSKEEILTILEPTRTFFGSERIQASDNGSVWHNIRARHITEEFQLEGETGSAMSGGHGSSQAWAARQLLWDDKRDIERFPAWWLHDADEEDYPSRVKLSPDFPRTYEQSPLGKAWTCTAVVPWIEFVEKKRPGAAVLQPNLFPVAWFEHTGLACQYAMSMAWQVGHIAGRGPESWEKPWMFQSFYVYEQFPIRALFSPLQCPAWCKTRPFQFTAALTHGGVQTLVSSAGFARDNAEIPLTAEDEKKLLGSFVDKNGMQLTLTSLDAPPTPHTSAAMEEGKDLMELFTS